MRKGSNMNSNALGGFLLVAGIVVLVGSRFGISFGHLPGDLVIKREGITIGVPLTSMLVLSVIYGIVRNLLTK